MAGAEDQAPVSPASAPAAPWRNFYGRTSGKTLRPIQRRRLGAELGPLVPAGIDRATNPERRPLDLRTLFATPRPLWLEIGFGGGEHMVHQAARHPEVGILGAEPFINGVAMLLRRIDEAGVRNVAIHPGDVRDLFDVLPAGSVGRVFLNYPDPWPKRRHHRRRFVTPEHLDPLARVMAEGAELRLATDIPDYMRQALEEVPPAGFALRAGPEPLPPWEGWITTRYEAKALREGRAPAYAAFVRSAAPVRAAAPPRAG
ncbi:MAG: tRNA (guanine(46)-N(7))-methyltransferase TrmB [Gemmobacter sp.]|jgi:tRNA (guanine-N7-)-methyltransferase